MKRRRDRKVPLGIEAMEGRITPTVIAPGAFGEDIAELARAAGGVGLFFGGGIVSRPILGQPFGQFISLAAQTTPG